jgi:HAD superfamily hydrolase (TIGR01509 family)
MRLFDYQAFIFDLDGTLINSEKYHAQAFADAVEAQCGYLLTEHEKREFFGSHSTRFSMVLNDRYGLNLVPDDVLRHKRQRVQEIFEVELFEGAHAFLKKWQGRKPMALGTNSPENFVMPALERAGLLEFFEVITTADHVKRRKPDPEIVEITLRALGVSASETLVFEDQLIGIEAAQRAGTAVLAVNNGQQVTFPKEVPVFRWSELLDL